MLSCTETFLLFYSKHSSRDCVEIEEKRVPGKLLGTAEITAIKKKDLDKMTENRSI